jgi:hypothetical protein
MSTPQAASGVVEVVKSPGVVRQELSDVFAADAPWVARPDFVGKHLTDARSRGG